MNIAIIADSLSENQKSTLAIMREGRRRKHEMKFFKTGGIGWPLPKILSTCGAALIRKNPPVDLRYLHLLYLLEPLEEKIFFINRPSSIRAWHEKFSILKFPEFITDTLVSSDDKEILKFAKKFTHGIVVKKLDTMGGHGAYHVRSNDSKARVIIEKATNHGRTAIMAQKFLPKIYTEGDCRILVLFGKVINVMARIPKKGDFRGNISVGAKAIPVTITSREQKICSVILPHLKRYGLHFVGLDIVDGFLSEINVTSPILGLEAYPKNAELFFDMLEKQI